MKISIIIIAPADGRSRRCSRKGRKMENIINELIKIENTAKQMTGEVEADKNNLPKKLEDREREIKAEAEAEYGEKARLMRERKAESAKGRIDGINGELQAKTAKLEKYFGENKEALAAEIFERII